jgi:hypothetical protein
MLINDRSEVWCPAVTRILKQILQGLEKKNIALLKDQYLKFKLAQWYSLPFVSGNIFDVCVRRVVK